MYGISVEIAELDLYEGITAEVRRFVLMDFFFFARSQAIGNHN